MVEIQKRRRNHALWVGPVLLLLGVVGFFSRWAGLLVLGAALAVALYGAWRAFTHPARWWSRAFALLVLLAAGGLFSRFVLNNFGGDVAVHSVEVEGLRRTYLVHAPREASRPLPVVLAFHGFMQTGRAFRRLSGLDAVADREGFLAVYPEGFRRSWNDGDDTKPATRQGIDEAAFIRQMIDRLARDYGIDRSRVYALGFSNGGFLLVRYACELSEEIAAIGVVGAGVYPVWDPSCRPARPVPAAFFVGTEDPMLRPLNARFELNPAASGSRWAAFNGCEGPPEEAPLPDRGEDGTRVIRESYGGCPDGAQVLHYRVEGGGHTWPGGAQYLPRFLIGPTSRDVEASAALWNFFSR